MIALGTHIKDTNITALSISLIVIILLVIINDVLKVCIFAPLNN